MRSSGQERPSLAAAGIRRGAELLAGLVHRGLEAGARLLPGVALDGNGTAPLALAVVVIAAALVLAGVSPGAAVGLGGGALAHAGALVVAAGPVPLAGVQAAAGVGLLRRRLFIGEQPFAAQHRAGEHAAERGEGQLAEIPSADVVLLHLGLLWKWVQSFLRGPARAPAPARHSWLGMTPESTLNTRRGEEEMGHQLIRYSIQYTTTPVTET